MIAVRANPLASTVWDIRRGASTSFQASFDLLNEEEKSRILNDIEFLSARTETNVEVQIDGIESSPEN